MGWTYTPAEWFYFMAIWAFAFFMFTSGWSMRTIRLIYHPFKAHNRYCCNTHIPPWVYGVMWTLIYATVAVTSWFVLTNEEYYNGTRETNNNDEVGRQKDRYQALALLIVLNVIINKLWSSFFWLGASLSVSAASQKEANTGRMSLGRFFLFLACIIAFIVLGTAVAVAALMLIDTFYEGIAWIIYGVWALFAFVYTCYATYYYWDPTMHNHGDRAVTFENLVNNMKNAKNNDVFDLADDLPVNARVPIKASSSKRYSRGR